MKIRVQCYAGYRGEQEPVAFWLDHRQVAVTSILDRWIGPDHRYFKVAGDDGSVYILRYDEMRGEWEMTFFRSDPSAAR
jgi:hypothetical protein